VRPSLQLYQLLDGTVIVAKDHPDRVAADLAIAWAGTWQSRNLTIQQLFERQQSLFPISGTVSTHDPNWGLQKDRIIASWKGRRSCPGPNGQPWALPRSLPSYFADFVIAQIVYIMQGGDIPGYSHHDLYWIGKKPIMTHLGPAHDASSVRDISVGNWQLRSAEEEAVAPVVEKSDLIFHPANVGWIKGRLINQPITRVNRRVYAARLLQKPFATLLLDFLKAFPSVLLQSMWAVLQAQGWPSHYIRFLKYIHQDMVQVTKLFGTTHTGPDKQAGLWTGSGASTILLLCLLDVLLRELYRSPGFSWDKDGMRP
jgi:hypothetical protein